MRDSEGNLPQKARYELVEVEGRTAWKITGSDIRQLKNLYKKAKRGF
jgi:hypothetical protein